eukprot:TRINITY_DN27288_c0_g1_i1.p1 TRINITY_DN27288_c0_g1~~TRINITY_DN27288_c0_g1_i1.p1  ORF type:complete len:664 (-),score=95.57 TRINITY_DN27288_c0_g1_i1:316-2307(-)
MDVVASEREPGVMGSDQTWRDEEASQPDTLGEKRQGEEARRAELGEEGDEKDRLLDDKLLRERTADGKAIISSDANVTESQKDCIAIVRSVLLVLLLATGVASLIVLAQRMSFMEGTSDPSTWRSFARNLSINICSAEPQEPLRLMPLPLDANTTSLNDALADWFNNKFKFVPVGPTAQMLGLSELRYFSSEEFVGEAVESYYLAMSFGLFTLSPTTFRVVIEGKGDCDNSDKRFARAVAATLRIAGRRESRNKLRVGLSDVHGALLLQMDANHPQDPLLGQVWDTPNSCFVGTFQRSPGWKAQQVSFFGLTAVLTILVAGVLSRALYVEWKEAIPYWVAKYDWLWSRPELHPTAEQLDARDMMSPTIDKMLKLSELSVPVGQGVDAVVRAPTTTGGVPFVDRIQLASLFFLLDDVLVDGQTNLERWLPAILSTLLQAAAVLVVLVVPMSVTFFIRAALIPFCVMALFHVGSSAAFGVCYYNSLPWRRRRSLLCLHFVGLGLCLIWNLAFMMAVVIFMVGRVVVEPEKVVGIAVPIVSIALYAVAIFSNLRSLQRTVQRRLRGEASQGHITRFLSYLQLSTIKIVLLVILTVLALILLTFVLLTLLALHKDSQASIMSDPVAAITVPVMTVWQGISVALARRSRVEKEIASYEKGVEKAIAII